MPAIAALTFANGEATPVNHTFTPFGQDPQTGVWLYRDQVPRISANGGSITWPSLTIGIKAAKLKNNGTLEPVHRISIQLAIPHMETLGTSDAGITPPPTLAFTGRWKCEYLIPTRYGTADLADLAAYPASITGHATIKSLVTTLTNLF